LYADKLSEHVSLLAYHYSRSTRTDKALHYLHLAAQRSFALYADTDAQLFWEEHLRVLNTLPPGTERDRQEVRTRLHLINVLSRQSNDGELTRSQFEAAAAACHRLGDARLLAELHATLAVAYVFWGRPRPGLSHARIARQLADSLEDLHLRVITCGPLAHLLWMAGSFTEGLQIAEEGLRLLQSHGLLTEQMGFVAYPYVQCLAIAGACRGFLGDFDQGLRDLHAAAASANQHGNRIPEALSQWGLALVSALRGDTVAAVRAADQAFSIMQEVSPTTGVPLVGALREYLTARETRTTVGSRPTSSCLLQTWHERRAFCEVAGTWLATLAVDTDQMEEALQYARTALARAEISESQWFLCTAHMTLGKILGHSRLRDPDVSVNHLLTALRYAEAMQSRSLCAQVTLLLGEEIGRSYGEGQRARYNEQSREFESEPYRGAQARSSTSGITETNELVRARQYLQQALELGGMLGMSAVCERAQALLTEFDIAAD
jgi:hypothetical protein